MYVVITYDSKAVCGSLDADFNAFGPYASYEEAANASALICTEDYEGSSILWMDPAERGTLPTVANIVRDALEGESNDAEHDALVIAAEFLNVTWEQR